MPPPPPPSIITSSSISHLSAPSTPAATAPPLMAQAPPLILTQTAGGTFLLPAAPGTGNAPPILLTAQVQKTNTPSAGFTLPFCLLCSQTYRSSSCWLVIFSHCHYTDTQSSSFPERCVQLSKVPEYADGDEQFFLHFVFSFTKLSRAENKLGIKISR